MAVDAAVMVSSSDADLSGATVTISASTLQSGDTLNFTNQNGISGNYSGGVLTLSGSATPAQYQTALQSVTFSTTSTVTITRSISIVAIDGALDSSPVAESLNVAVAAPIVMPSGTTITYTVDGSAFAVDSGVTVTSSDTNLSGATVAIAANTLKTGDELNFTNQSGISGNYSGGVLSLSGTATVAQYQTALRSVTFSTSSSNTTARTISIVAIDGTALYGALNSAPAAESVKVSTTALTLTPSGTTNTFLVGGAPVAVDSGLTGSPSGNDLTGATVTISNYQSGDSLYFTNQNGISGGYASGVLTLSGVATVAQYQTALQSVTFSTTSANTAVRSLSIVAIDGSLDSNTATEHVNIETTVLALTPSGTTNTFTAGGAAFAVDAGLAVSPYDANLSGATVTIGTGYQSADALHFTNQNGISGIYSGGVLTLSGSATPAQYQTALQSVTFSTTSANTTTREISIVAFDWRTDQQFGSRTGRRVDYPANADSVGHDEHIHSRWRGGRGRFGTDGESQQLRPDSCQRDDLGRHPAVGRQAQFHQPERHQRQLRRWRALLDGHCNSGPIRDGLAVGHLLHYKRRHRRPVAFDRRHRWIAG